MGIENDPILILSHVANLAHNVGGQANSMARGSRTPNRRSLKAMRTDLERAAACLARILESAE